MGGKIMAVLVALALVWAVPGVSDAEPSGSGPPPELLRVLPITGGHTVPDDAEMVAVNITAVAPDAAGHVTAYSCDEPLPTASNLNYGPGDTVPNLALVRISGEGTICIATHTVVDIVVDIVGYVPAGSTIEALDAPERIIDTRLTGDPVAAGTRRSIGLGELIDEEATLAMFNLTSVGAEAPGHATVFACTTEVPDSSSLNYEAGRTVANFVIARLSADQRVCLHSHATSDFVIDLVATANGGIITLDEPRRLHDSRTTPDGPVAGGTTLYLDIVHQPQIADTATAAVYNLTAAVPTAAGHATSYPCDQPQPKASNLNYRAGHNSSNGTITVLSARGELCIAIHATTHLVVDLIGYITDHEAYVPVSPDRIDDTREDEPAECPWVAASAPWATSASGHQLDVHPIDGSPPIRNAGFYDYSTKMRPGSSLDCSKVLFMGAGDGSFDKRLVALSTTTPNSPVQRLGDSISALHNRYLAVQQLNDESYLAVNNRGTVIDATTGEVLWQHPDSSIFALRAAIARNGLVALRTGSHLEITNRDGTGRIEVWDMTTGKAVSVIPVPDENIEFDLSPDGKYLAIDLVGGALSGSPTTSITTVDGEVVESRTTDSAAITRFLGPRVVTQCINGVGLTRHELLGPWTPGFLPLIAPRQALELGARPCAAVWP